MSIGGSEVLAAIPELLKLAEKLELHHYLPGKLDRKSIRELQQAYRMALVQAQAKRDSERILTGECTAADLMDGLQLGRPVKPEPRRREEPQLGVSPLAQAIANSTLRDRIRADLNATQALLFAAEAASSARVPPSDKPINEDWLRAWKRGAESVSSEDLQQLWGSLLAGEIQAPGQYSLRTIRFLETISSDEAKEIAAVLTFAFDGQLIFKCDALETLGWGFARLLKLEEIGLLSGVSTAMSVSLKSASPDQFFTVRTCHDVMLEITGTNAIIPSFRAYSLTEVARDLCRLGKFVSDATYIEEVERLLQKHRMNVRRLPSPSVLRRQ